MTRKNGTRFPNGKTKSFLYEVFFNFGDFGCTPAVYEEEMAIARRQEANNYPNCSWYQDLDGKFIVDGLRLQNPYIRIEITENEFQKIPTLTRRSKLAQEHKLKEPSELHRLFTPHHAVSEPLRFVGRSVEMKRVINANYNSGRLFLVSGERSIGKTSFAQVVVHVFNGNKDIARFYGVKEGQGLDSRFLPVFIDASIGPSNVTDFLGFLDDVLSYTDYDSHTITDRVSVNALGVFRFERSMTAEASKTVTAQNIVDQLQEHNEAGRRLVLVIDEFDSFEDPEKLSPLLRHFITHGAVICIVSTEVSLNALVSGHISIARHVIPIKLDSLPEAEFKEIFYLAEVIAEGFVKFEEAALQRIYEESAGLPYFGQLFGYLTITALIDRDGSPEQFIKARKATGPAIVYSNMVDQLISRFPKECEQYEHSFRVLSSQLPQGTEILQYLAKHGAASPSDLSEITNGAVTEADLSSWRDSDQFTSQMVSNKNGNLKLYDPVFRQYINIRRHTYNK